MHFLIVFCLLLGLFHAGTPPVRAGVVVKSDECADQVKTFKSAYGDYQKHLADGAFADAYLALDNAISTARFVFSAKSASPLALQVKKAELAGLLPEKSGEATRLFEEVLAQYKNRYGARSPTLIDPLLLYGDMVRDTHKDVEKARKLYRQALDLLVKDSPKNALLRADINLRRARLNLHGMVAKQESERHGGWMIGRFMTEDEFDERGTARLLKSALKAFKKYAPDDLARQAAVNRSLGDLYRVSSKPNKAVSPFEMAHGYFSTTAPGSAPDEAVRRGLIGAYLETGAEEKATEMLLSLAKMKAAAFDPRPVYEAMPKVQSVRSSGKVTLSFEVDEKGFVINPEVVGRVTYISLANSSMAAIKDFRYLPKIEKGIPIRRTGVTHTFDFDIESANRRGFARRTPIIRPPGLPQ